MSNAAEKDVVIVGMARTPIGSFMGSISSINAVDLSVIAGKAALERAGVSPQLIDEVTAGMVYKDGVKGNPARQIQMALGCPASGVACTIDQQCGSSMRALEIAAQQIMLGKTQVALVVGVESMSNVPYLMLNARSGLRMGPGTIEDALLYDGLFDAMGNGHMGNTAENVAEMYNISREDQDKQALLSQERALAAMEQGYFNEEITPVTLKTRKGEVVIDKDEHPRPTTLEQLAKMKPAFKKDGTVTAGNASGINDGACAVVIMSAKRAAELGLKPLIRILSTASVGVEPRIMGIGPVYAIPKAIELAGLTQADIEYFEINEAFAAQAVACLRELNIPANKVNGCGAGIAMGHPVGMTSLRLLITGYYEMKRRGVTIGCASLCVGGGPAIATVFERLN